MQTAIVGYTGFVGSNLCRSFDFDRKYNSQNIGEAFATSPDLLVYSGVPAEMFLANKFPERDLDVIEGAIENIRRIQAGKVVLISTIAVYDHTVGVDEDTVIDNTKSTVYGRHRHMLEQWVLDNCQNPTIVRLPAIYGPGLKKNFIYDMINVIPSMLTGQKFAELSMQSHLIAHSYAMNSNGYYCLTADRNDRQTIEALKSEFRQAGFTALSFTDSRSQYQFFDLQGLWPLIEKSVAQDLRVVNVATPPLTAARVYEYVYGQKFVNQLDKAPFMYDFRTIHCDVLGGCDGYLMSANDELNDLKKFIINSI